MTSDRFPSSRPDVRESTDARPPQTRPSWPLGLDGLAYGGDYNPEQWTRETWVEDVRLMREAGVNLVSIGMFSWASIEPRQGEFHWEWLDEIFELLHEAGIRIDLGTPTAAPPAWFFRAHPESRVVDRAGRSLGPGSRGMACPSSPAYRSAATGITRALAERYGDHPALALWHVHNEYGAPVGESFSTFAQDAFRHWALRRHGSLEAVNSAWGTAFWGQSFGVPEEIHAPLPTPSVHNPSLALDWRRFSSEQILECFRAERDVLHELAPHIPVTTNFMAHTCRNIDLWKWADEVDVVSNDHYLIASDDRNFVELALDADLARSIARGRPWMLMEHSTSGVNWQGRNVAKQPGEMARNSLSHVGRGADAVMFFQWRASRKGAEKFHSAMLPHAGTNSRIWREVRELGTQLEGLAGIRGTRVRADVAILWDWESHWAQDLPWRPADDLSHRAQIQTWYERLWRDHLAADFAHPEDDLSGYRLVLAPASYLLTDAAAAKLAAYVREGGNLVVGPFSGVVDAEDGVREGGLNASLAPVLGVEVHEFCPLRKGDDARIVLGGHSVRARLWCEDLQLRGAEPIGSYADGPVSGGVAATQHTYGQGTAWYLASDLDVVDLSVLFSEPYCAAGLAPRELPEDVELLERIGEDGTRHLIALNHTAEDQALPAGDHGTVSVPAHGVATSRRPRVGA
ncbi:beta-galactosidase [Brachybacterium vulturis]|uniref:Beta-galactosidase n=1 Tax=Brachybacterium vulturis TaxID=2017484 RepID=A0A291GJH6_9MICO|nr:beta-galactosidase [Brachybacterium vulturis]ATG50202.1 beta-galactosidase [Brachybacterium vulturis]